MLAVCEVIVFVFVIAGIGGLVMFCYMLLLLIAVGHWTVSASYFFIILSAMRYCVMYGLMQQSWNGVEPYVY